MFRRNTSSRRNSSQTNRPMYTNRRVGGNKFGGGECASSYDCCCYNDPYHWANNNNNNSSGGGGFEPLAPMPPQLPPPPPPPRGRGVWDLQYSNWMGWNWVQRRPESAPHRRKNRSKRSSVCCGRRGEGDYDDDDPNNNSNNNNYYQPNPQSQRNFNSYNNNNPNPYHSPQPHPYASQMFNGPTNTFDGYCNCCRCCCCSGDYCTVGDYFDEVSQPPMRCTCDTQTDPHLVNNVPTETTPQQRHLASKPNCCCRHHRCRRHNRHQHSLAPPLPCCHCCCCSRRNSVQGHSPGASSNPQTFHVNYAHTTTHKAPTLDNKCDQWKLSKYANANTERLQFLKNLRQNNSGGDAEHRNLLVSVCEAILSQQSKLKCAPNPPKVNNNNNCSDLLTLLLSTSTNDNHKVRICSEPQIEACTSSDKNAINENNRQRSRETVQRLERFLLCDDVNGRKGVDQQNDVYLENTSPPRFININ